MERFVRASALASDLQTALAAAQPYDVIRLDSGATYSGAFELPAKTGPVTLAGRALIRADSIAPALRTAPSAHDWTLAEGLTICGGDSDVLRLGHSTQTLEDIPRRLLLQDITIEGGVTGCRRGIALNSAETVLRRVTVRNAVLAGMESQAVCGWNTPGNIVIEDCDLQGGSIGLMFGGAVPSISGLVPTGIVVRRTYIHRPVYWRTQRYACKNLFELKNARNVLLADCTLENNWLQGQHSFAIVLTPRASGADASWTVVADVTIRNNVIRHCGGGINALATDTNNPSGPLSGVVIAGNQFIDIDGGRWGGRGSFLQCVNGPAGLVVRDNVVLNAGDAIFADAGPASNRKPAMGLIFTGNRLAGGKIRGNAVGTANQALGVYFPDAEVRGNILAGESAATAPPDNAYPTRADFLSTFVAPFASAAQR